MILQRRTTREVRPWRLRVVDATAAARGVSARMPGIFAALLSLCALAGKPIATTEPGYRIDSWDT